MKKTHNLKSIEKLTNNKWLNLYMYHYENQDYLVASRKSQENLVINSKDSTPDAVRIVPYFVENGKTYVVFINEFRCSINKYIWGFPAGLVDKGEDPLMSAKREVLEEIGGTVEEITQTTPLGYSSAGLTDESLICYTAKIRLDSKQHLEDSEDISIKVVEAHDIPKMLQENEFCLSSAILARAFYFEVRERELLAQLNDKNQEEIVE